MSMSTDSASSILRRGLLWLAGLTTLGLAVELAAERHWTQPIQLVAWGALGAVSAAIALLARPPSRRAVQLARILAVAVLLSAVLGVGAHVYANYDSGALDRRYSDSWDSLSETTRWWLALSKTVGPAPPLAPGALAQAGLSLLLATLHHPALRRAQAPVAIDR
jgi:hypothetical protein